MVTGVPEKNVDDGTPRLLTIRSGGGDSMTFTVDLKEKKLVITFLLYGKVTEKV